MIYIYIYKEKYHLTSQKDKTDNYTCTTLYLIGYLGISWIVRHFLIPKRRSREENLWWNVSVCSLLFDRAMDIPIHSFIDIGSRLMSFQNKMGMSDWYDSLLKDNSMFQSSNQKSWRQKRFFHTTGRSGRCVNSSHSDGWHVPKCWVLPRFADFRTYH